MNKIVYKTQMIELKIPEEEVGLCRCSPGTFVASLPCIGGSALVMWGVNLVLGTRFHQHAGKNMSITVFTPTRAGYSLIGTGKHDGTRHLPVQLITVRGPLLEQLGI
jgi:hypothetical protein